jgi:tetratricopeptide (TPR) repeat protein
MGWRASAIGMTAVLASLGAAGTWAADKPIYGPPPSWVREVAIDTGFKPTGAAVDVLLFDQQQRMTPGADENFVEVASRVNASEGLASLGSVIEAWDPSTQSFAIHRARIIRDGKTIDLLADGKTFTVLRRETNLEAATIDGQLTATLQPEGLRVGDIVDVATSWTRHEPALAGHSVTAVFTGFPGAIHRVLVRTSWLKSRPPHIFQSDDLPRFTRADAKDRVEFGFEQTDPVRPESPKGAPPFESIFGVAMLSDFSSWDEVSRSLYPLFDKAAALTPGSPLKAEIARISAAHPDSKGRTLAALELVESDIRYLAVMINAGGYTPAAADLTWSRRFGDCKGKTVLLLALLRGLGIEAVPALVQTTGGDGLDRFPATLDIFDHVILEVSLNGSTYWLDGTRQGDEDLDVIPIPNYHFALPLTPTGSTLERLKPKDPALPTSETRLIVDLSAGIDSPAKLHREVIYRGDAALGLKLHLKAASSTDRERALRDMLADEDWMKPDKLDFTYDPKTMTFTGTLDGKGTPPFTTPDGNAASLRDWEPAPALVRVSTDLRRTSDYHRDAPYAVDYPNFSRDVVEITLPDGGKGFTLTNNGPVNREAGGVSYSRAASLKGGRFVEIISRRALNSTFPASEAETVQANLKNLNNYEVSLRYDPRPQTAAASSPASAARADTDPEARAQDAYRAKDFSTADIEYGKAIALHPSAKLYYNRAVVRGAVGKIALAEDDLNKAVALDPKEPMALFALGRLAVQRSNFGEADRRFAAAFESAPAKATMARRIAQTYNSAKRYAESVPYWDRTVDADGAADHQKARDLASDCWTRTRIGVEVQKAHAMCEESLTLAPSDVEDLNIAGFSDIRLGAFRDAVARFDQALTLGPKSSDARFGRSIAERKLGQVEKANADRDAAIAADPKVADGMESFTAP